MSAGEAYSLPPEKPLCTHTIRGPTVLDLGEERLADRGASASWSSSHQPAPGACVYTFQPTIGWSWRSRCMPSICAPAAPTVGCTPPCSSTRPSPHTRSARWRAVSMCGIESGFTASGIGIAVRIIIDVSDWLNSRSRYCSTEKHARASASPQARCGNELASPSIPLMPGAAAAQVVVQVVGLDVEHELVARERATSPRRDPSPRPSGRGTCRRSASPSRRSTRRDTRRAPRASAPRHRRCAGTCGGPCPDGARRRRPRRGCAGSPPARPRRAAPAGTRRSSTVRA